MGKLSNWSTLLVLILLEKQNQKLNGEAQANFMLDMSDTRITEVEITYFNVAKILRHKLVTGVKFILRKITKLLIIS